MRQEALFQNDLAQNPGCKSMKRVTLSSMPNAEQLGPGATKMQLGILRDTPGCGSGPTKEGHELKAESGRKTTTDAERWRAAHHRTRKEERAG